MNHNRIQYILLAAIATGVVGTTIRSDTQNTALLERVQVFMNKGGRNTNVQGYQLCERVTALENSDYDCVAQYAVCGAE